jgi:hypothetical protein
MTNKRQLARAALQAWKTKTTAEMFIEQHKDVHFAKTNKSPKVELVSNTERYMELVTQEFAHLSMRKANPCLIKSAFAGMYAHAMNIADIITIEDDKYFESTIQSLGSSQSSRSLPKEFDLDSYKGISSNLSPLRC